MGSFVKLPHYCCCCETDFVCLLCEHHPRWKSALTYCSCVQGNRRSEAEPPRAERRALIRLVHIRQSTDSVASPGRSHRAARVVGCVSAGTANQ